jgi:hypothetical protein
MCVGQTPVGENVCQPKSLSAKKSVSQNVCQPKCLSAKMFVGQVFFYRKMRNLLNNLFLQNKRKNELMTSLMAPRLFVENHFAD